MEASETRGTTAMVYLQLHSSLYTGTVLVLSSVAGVHPTGLTADQGCREVSAPKSLFGEGSIDLRVDRFTKPFQLSYCLRQSRRGLVQEDKRMAFVYTHGLFIT